MLMYFLVCVRQKKRKQAYEQTPEEAIAQLITVRGALVGKRDGLIQKITELKARGVEETEGSAAGAARRAQR